jgi:ankyrin repeat protein
MTNDRAGELLALALAGDEEKVRALLPPADNFTEDGQPNTANGVTALMGAAACGHDSTVALLLQRGADPSRRDSKGRSAAGYARAAGHPHLAERLDTVVDLEKTMW